LVDVGEHAVAGGSHARRHEEAGTEEDDRGGDDAGEHVADGNGDGHDESS
jgi:hypothetical protein